MQHTAKKTSAQTGALTVRTGENAEQPAAWRRRIKLVLALLCLAVAVPAFAAGATDGMSVIDGFAALFIFMLAAFTGHEIIGKVPVILHTPLMSGSNFVHGIVLVGAMIALGHADTQLGKILGFIGVLLGAGNAAGGYVVTERMLQMFKSSKKGS